MWIPNETGLLSLLSSLMKDGSHQKEFLSMPKYLSLLYVEKCVGSGGIEW